MIELKNISLTKDKKIIFQNFNLKVHAKERLVILGASGSGKTTLLRLMAGLTVASEGEILLNSKRVSYNQKIYIEPHQRHLSMVFQDLALWHHLSVEGNIEFGLKVKKIKKIERQKSIKKMLELVNLEGYEKRSIETLSGGEQQRVALARALVLSPKILLMDEPLSSLDQKLNKALRKKIVELQKNLNFTLVYVTHNIEEANEIATRVFTLET